MTDLQNPSPPRGSAPLRQPTRTRGSPDPRIRGGARARVRIKQTPAHRPKPRRRYLSPPG